MAPVHLTTITENSPASAINDNFRKLQAYLASEQVRVEKRVRQGEEAKEFLDRWLGPLPPISRKETYQHLEEANQRIEEARRELEDAQTRLDQAEQDLSELQSQLENLDLSGVLKESAYYNGIQISDDLGLEAVRSDNLIRTLLNATHGIVIQRRNTETDPWTNVFYVDAQTQQLTLDGNIIARNITLSGDVAAQNARITGTLIGSAATLLQVDIEDANIVNANIQDATISGTLVGVDGTFTGDIITAQNAYVGNYLYLGDQSNIFDTKGIRFNTEAFIETNVFGSRLHVYGAGKITIHAPGSSQGDIELLAGRDILMKAGGIVKASSFETERIEGLRRIDGQDDWSWIDIHADVSLNNYQLSDVGWLDVRTVDVSGRVYTDRVAGYSGDLNTIYFGTSDRMVLTRTDSYPHYGLILGRVMVKGLDSSTEQVQIRNRNDTSYRDLVLRDMYCTGNGYFGPSESYMYMRSTTTYGYIHSPAGGAHYIRVASNGQVAIYVDGTARHIFQPTGTKTGGSYEFEDGRVLGMSPIDSPQAPIEYLLFDVEVTEEGTEVQLDPRFVEIVDGKYSVFVSASDSPVRIENKQSDRFTLKGPIQKVDLRLIGIRKDCKNQFWVDMAKHDSEEDEAGTNSNA